METIDKERYAELNKEISRLDYLMKVIEARYTKDIWTDHAFDKDRKDVLRKAELTLRLDADTEYKSLQLKMWNLEAERDVISDGLDLLL